jgi:hypothetical protein
MGDRWQWGMHGELVARSVALLWRFTVRMPTAARWRVGAQLAEGEP